MLFSTTPCDKTEKSWTSSFWLTSTQYELLWRLMQFCCTGITTHTVDWVLYNMWLSQPLADVFLIFENSLQSLYNLDNTQNVCHLKWLFFKILLKSHQKKELSKVSASSQNCPKNKKKCVFMAESLAWAITVFSYAWNKVKTILKLALYLHQAVIMFFFLNKILVCSFGLWKISSAN